MSHAEGTSRIISIDQGLCLLRDATRLLARELVNEHTPVQLLDDPGILPNDLPHVCHNSSSLSYVIHPQTCMSLTLKSLSLSSMPFGCTGMSADNDLTAKQRRGLLHRLLVSAQA